MDNKKIIQETVMKTLSDMFNEDDYNYRQLKLANKSYKHIFKIEKEEYKDLFILRPVSKEALNAFIKITGTLHVEKPYIYVCYHNNEWHAKEIYATYKDTGHDYCYEFSEIRDSDPDEFMKKLYEFIFK